MSSTSQFKPSLALGLKERRQAYSVYIVDDSSIDRTFLKRLLVKQGFEIAGEASNGEDAIKSLKQLLDSPPDIFFVDQEMPYMSGTETILRLKRLFPEAKIIMISAYSSKELVRKVLELKIH
ncbi:MAG: response regulator, partial [Spirochaetota bacterium]